MAIDVLLESLSREAEAEAARVIAEARDEAARIRAAAEAAAADRCERALAMRGAAIRAETELRRARVRQEAGIEVLQARARFLDRIFGAAEAAFPGALGDSSRPALERLISEALEFFPAMPVTIRCRTGLAGAVTEVTASLGTVTVEVDDAVGEGVVVEAGDGSARVDNTLAARLQRLRPRLAIELLAEAERR